MFYTLLKPTVFVESSVEIFIGNLGLLNKFPRLAAHRTLLGLLLRIYPFYDAMHVETVRTNAPNYMKEPKKFVEL